MGVVICVLMIFRAFKYNSVYISYMSTELSKIKKKGVTQVIVISDFRMRDQYYCYFLVDPSKPSPDPDFPDPPD